ncbi:hypothetical protein [Acidaminobacter hydrogenoformans]|uniref:Wobble nucleotide-excising tRNase n=1 Tax=Acidaminobacter hydrogenoformans DSM 2784 TaxID=1120920 RepID=A0A1G5S5J6_9FIRM|nr:hypothetical protein [Acidaminobacter hydrogenoformans]SCZ81583.1 hypothetical protein SAMN03080599_02866 [Acidaminobacter hydrogenoformans DSM 2784]
MKKITINLENCYGIKRLQETFNFEYLNKKKDIEKSSSICIYAPNGMMKTSFAKTFYKLSKSETPKEEIHDKTTVCEVMINGEPIKPNEIFVIKSAVDMTSEPEHVSTLLVDEDKKREYESIFKTILELKKTFIIKMNRLSGIKKEDVEKEILNDFGAEDIYKCLQSIDVSLYNDDFSDLKYSEIFDKDVIDFLKTKEVQGNIKDYMEKYNSIIEEYPFFSKGKFNLTRADKVVKTLSDEGFFVSQNSVMLTGEDHPLSELELKEKIEETQNKINSNAELKKIRSLLTGKAKCKRFEEIIEGMDDVSTFFNEIVDIDQFKKKIWVSYFKSEAVFSSYIEEYNENIVKLNEIENLAEFEKTKWKVAIDKFNDRFGIRYILDIENKKSAIVGKEVPSVVIKTMDEETGEWKVFKRNELNGLDVLSQGEKRALYLLNIIFEVEARKESTQKTLFIVDDIADSFDYKNKYAIIQYLREISEDPNFYQIVLTHNFDFFRTLQSRYIKYKDCYIAVKDEQGIRLETANGIKNPFILDWKKNLKDRKKLIASIPFVRNIIEYTQGTDGDNYQDLTSLLHYKPTISENISIERIRQVFCQAIPNIIFPEFETDTPSITTIIQTEAAECLHSAEGINLENKIVLSIALRLKAEKYMIDKISDDEFIGRLFEDCKERNGSQTYPIFKKYFEMFPDDDKCRKLIDEINLTTPENIHVNSFMFEPILDMSDAHLKKIYAQALELLKIEDRKIVI